jgi:putative FmdB family regulatory protein
MPTYEYACKGCGEHLEVVQSFKDDPLTECPSCHGELRKVFSAAGLIFKGSGWHVKDYASPSRGKGGSSRPSGDRESTSSSGDATSTSSSDTSSSSTPSSTSSSASSSKDTSSSSSSEARSA